MKQTIAHPEYKIMHVGWSSLEYHMAKNTAWPPNLSQTRGWLEYDFLELYKRLRIHLGQPNVVLSENGDYIIEISWLHFINKEQKVHFTRLEPGQGTVHYYHAKFNYKEDELTAGHADVIGNKK